MSGLWRSLNVGKWRRIATLRARKAAGKLSGPMEPTKAQSKAERVRN